MIWYMPYSFLIVCKKGRNDEDQVCSQVHTASVDKIPKWLQTNRGREHRLGPHKQSEFNKTDQHSHPESILNVGDIVGVGGKPSQHGCSFSWSLWEKLCLAVWGMYFAQYLFLNLWLHYPLLPCLDLCGIAKGLSFEVCVGWAQNEPMFNAKEWPHWEESLSLSYHWPFLVRLLEQNTRWKGKGPLALGNSEAEIPGQLPCQPWGNCRILIGTFQKSTLSEPKVAFADIWSFWDADIFIYKMTLVPK